MQLNEYKRIEELLKRFFEGETSNTEEQELYDFFSLRELPEHLKPYRSVFSFFETGIVQEVAEMEKTKPVRKKSLIRYLVAGIAVAAAALLLFVLNKQGAEKGGDFNPYSGSYIIHNGVRKEIPEDIARELYKTIIQSEYDKSYMSRTAYSPDSYFERIMDRQHQKEAEIDELKQRINELEGSYLNR